MRVKKYKKNSDVRDERDTMKRVSARLMRTRYVRHYVHLTGFSTMCVVFDILFISTKSVEKNLPGQ